MPKAEWDAVVYDPSDDSTAYWVAWCVEDNPGGATPLMFRVYRDERKNVKGVPVTEAMSRGEAYAELYKLKLLLGTKQ